MKEIEFEGLFIRPASNLTFAPEAIAKAVAEFNTIPEKKIHLGFSKDGEEPVSIGTIEGVWMAEDPGTHYLMKGRLDANYQDLLQNKTFGLNGVIDDNGSLSIRSFSIVSKDGLGE